MADFSKLTRIDPIKIRRLLKTGFLKGEKISVTQWHIPREELMKIQGYRPPAAKKAKKNSPALPEESVSLEEFSKQTGLTPTKIKHFIRTRFIEGGQDENNVWRIKKGQVSKFKKT